VIFVGTLHYWPNTEAVLRFTKKILPLIRAKCPTVEFWIVGLGPAQEILDLDDGKAVRVFPDVPEVIDYVREAAVSVVPLRIGGGTRLKILESLAAGVPVVSTTVGVEGIALVPDTHLFVADEPQDFANRVCRLLGDPTLREQQVSAARSAIASEYSWSSIRERVGQKLASLASSLSENPATRSQKVDKG
jgi:glycosyltransferase involved in cell wall biosynthesis